jgi:RNA-binding protein YhbY
MKTLSQIQLGKNKITESFIETLRDHFKNHENVKISVLKTAGHDKRKVKEYAEEILNKLGKNYTSKTIGFTISIKKWRKNVR